MSRVLACSIVMVVFAVSVMAPLTCFVAERAWAEGDVVDEPLPQIGEAGKATLVCSKENVCASELLGTWVVNQALSEGINPQYLHAVDTVIFERSDEASVRVMSELPKSLGKMRESADANTNVRALHFERALQTIYLTGKIKGQKLGRTIMEGSFALSSVYGNPVVLVYLNGESSVVTMNVMLARDPDGEQDMLFIGGSDAASYFLSYNRKKAGKD